MPSTGKPGPGALRRWGSHWRPGSGGGWDTENDDLRDLCSVLGILPRLRPLSLPKLKFPNLDPPPGKVAEAGSARERGCETEEGAACWMELVLAASSSLFLRKEALRP